MASVNWLQNTQDEVAGNVVCVLVRSSGRANGLLNVSAWEHYGVGGTFTATPTIRNPGTDILLISAHKR